MWWYYGHSVWGLWFVFPVIGFIFMMVMMFLFFRGKGALCGFNATRDLESLKNEVRELKTEVEALRKQTKEGQP
jgi:uncharacterized membrane protein